MERGSLSREEDTRFVLVPNVLADIIEATPVDMLFDLFKLFHAHDYCICSRLAALFIPNVRFSCSGLVAERSGRPFC
jgi:hypothetical protein